MYGVPKCCACDLTFTAGSVRLCGLCSHPLSDCEVVFVPYVDAVTVMYVLLYVMRVCMLRECEGCEGDDNAGVWGQGMCGCSGCECMGGTRGSYVVSSADDVLEMRVVRGATCVDGVC